jgi:mono/diheme cytochrome c family protein
MIRPPEAYAGNTDPIAYPATALPPSGTDVGWPAWTAAGLQEGKELYNVNCMTCHGCSGNGLGTYGGTLVVTPANFKQEPFRSMPDDQWFWHVSEGVQGTVMPPWKESLTEDQRWKAIRYVQDTFARPVMRDPAEGDLPPAYADLTNPLPLTLEVLDQGKAIWTRECMVCHGDAGRGEGPYGDGIQPRPPDFGDGSYGTLADPTFTDADYYWRISEGLPWSAMQVWKLQYAEDDRWALVHYIRTMFTQTEERPPAPEEDVEFLFPEVYKPLEIPGAASFERGKQVFLTTCSHCHGLAGDGTGWDGAYLDPAPADFREDAGKPLGATDQGEYLARVTFGNMDTAMPSWGEFLPEDQRWDVIKFIVDSFRIGRPAAASVYGSGAVAANFVTLSQDNWVGEGNVISETHGADLYGTYCSTCHGSQGLGDGSGLAGNASKGPAPFPRAMSEPYILWRTWEGVPDTLMPPFHWLLSEADIWDITAYVENLVGTK